VERETVHGITSLPRTLAGPEDLLTLSRVHIGHLLILAAPVEPADVLVGRFIVRSDHSCFPHQSRDVRLPVFAGVAADDGLHRRIRFQRGRIDADRLAGQQLLLRRDLEHELEDFGEHFGGQAAAGQRQGRVVGAVLRERQSQEGAEREAVGTGRAGSVRHRTCD